MECLMDVRCVWLQPPKEQCVPLPTVSAHSTHTFPSHSVGCRTMQCHERCLTGDCVLWTRCFHMYSNVHMELSALPEEM